MLKQIGYHIRDITHSLSILEVIVHSLQSQMLIRPLRNTESVQLLHFAGLVHVQYAIFLVTSTTKVFYSFDKEF